MFNYLTYDHFHHLLHTDGAARHFLTTVAGVVVGGLVLFYVHGELIPEFRATKLGCEFTEALPRGSPDAQVVVLVGPVSNEMDHGGSELIHASVRSIVQTHFAGNGQTLKSCESLQRARGLAGAAGEIKQRSADVLLSPAVLVKGEQYTLNILLRDHPSQEPPFVINFEGRKLSTPSLERISAVVAKATVEKAMRSAEPRQVYKNMEQFRAFMQVASAKCYFEMQAGRVALDIHQRETGMTASANRLVTLHNALGHFQVSQDLCSGEADRDSSLRYLGVTKIALGKLHWELGDAGAIDTYVAGLEDLRAYVHDESRRRRAPQQWGDVQSDIGSALRDLGSMYRQLNRSIDGLAALTRAEDAYLKAIAVYDDRGLTERADELRLMLDTVLRPLKDQAVAALLQSIRSPKPPPSDSKPNTASKRHKKNGAKHHRAGAASPRLACTFSRSIQGWPQKSAFCTLKRVGTHLRCTCGTAKKISSRVKHSRAQKHPRRAIHVSSRKGSNVARTPHPRHPMGR